MDRGTNRTTVPRTVFEDWEQDRDLYVYVEGGTVRMSENYPAPASGRFRRLLARLICRNGAYSVVQEQHGPVIENYHMALALGGVL